MTLGALHVACAALDSASAAVAASSVPAKLDFFFSFMWTPIPGLVIDSRPFAPGGRTSY